MALMEQLIAFGAEAFGANLILSTCGNASLRDGNAMQITASGSRLGALTPADLCLVDLLGGLCYQGPRPSSEAGLHRQIYLARPDVGAVLHCQSEAATVLACHRDPPRDLNFIPEVGFYVGEHAYVPYLEPGCPELAEQVRDRLRSPDVNVVQLQNHGQVIVGADWREVLRRAIFFERACRLALLGGSSLVTISPADVAVLRKRGGTCTPKPWQGRDRNGSRAGVAFT